MRRQDVLQHSPTNRNQELCSTEIIQYQDGHESYTTNESCGQALTKAVAWHSHTYEPVHILRDSIISRKVRLFLSYQWRANIDNQFIRLYDNRKNV